jgi:hypothetical protein
MKKKILVLSMLLLTSVATGFAAGGTTGSLIWTLENGTLTISGEGAMENFPNGAPWYSNRASITTLVIGNGVTSIGLNAFYECSRLTSITLPASIVSFGMQAFYGCSSLTSFTVPAGLTSIEDNILGGCSSLSAILVEDGNTHFSSEEGVLFNSDKTTLSVFPGGKGGHYTIPGSVISIGNFAFNECSNLTSVTVGDKVESIGYAAFSDCIKLASIVIPESVTSIEKFAFSDCINLASIVIPNSVTSMGECAFIRCNKLASVIIGNKVESMGEAVFYKCSSLASIVIPNSVTSMGDYAFTYCSNLNSVIIGDKVESIGYAAFADCSSLTSIVIPNSVTGIGEFVFNKCSKLASVIIGNKVESIGYAAFADCSSLTSIVIPNSVTSIGEFTFEGCTQLTSVTNLNPTPQPIAETVFEDVDLSQAALHVPAESVADYRAAAVWKDFGTIAEYLPSAITAPVTGNDVRIYPNPAKDDCKLFVSKEFLWDSPVKYAVVSPQGQVSQRGSVHNEETLIPVNQLAPGIYFVVVYNDSKIIGNQRLVKR